MLFTKEGNKYTLTKSYHQSLIERQDIYGIKRLEHRSSVIPSKVKDTFKKNRFSSTMIQCLNGDYKFIHLEKAPDDEELFKPNYDDSEWDTLSVPSMWQYHGYGKCTYPNIFYHFPFDPPYIRCDNPVGIYRKHFKYNGDGENCILHFSGVMSAFFVYINGEFAGFGKGSRNAAEFDVTELLKKGDNLIAVKVYTWSDASYLENQDMLNANGIFRDVYLIKTAKTYVWDYALITDTEKISAEITVNNPTENTRVKILCDGKEYMCNVTDGKACAVIYIDNPLLWTAETPNTYCVYIELYQGDELLEVHSKKVGLRTSEVVGNKLLVNGKPIMLKGINRHEHNRKNGMAISDQQIEHELKLIKEFNINAIRCSHYTNHPLFYELATELGIYVMDETDLESHGAGATGDQGALSKMNTWLYSYLYRTKAMIENNKNESCIIIWSIGNEVGQGPNLERCAEYIRSTPYVLPIHQSQDGDKSSSYDNFRKNGYCTLHSMQEEFYPLEGKPVVLTEYAHGMGNTPGCLEDYWDYMYSHEQYCGGFVWEFKSHGFYAEDKDGNSFSKYGGDFDKSELNHWINFTIDGYTQSDITPKPALYELKEAVSPVKVWFEDGKILCRNTNDFRDLSYLTLKWSILEDYTSVSAGEMQMPTIPARSSDILEIPTLVNQIKPGAVYRADLVFYDGERLVSHKQVELPYISKKIKFAPEKVNLSCKTDGEGVIIRGDDFSVTFINGLPHKYQKNGRILFDGGMKFNFFRAVTDNDHFKRSVKSIWENYYHQGYFFKLTSMTIEEEADGILLKSEGLVTQQGLFGGFKYQNTFKILKDGLILTEIHGVPYGDLHPTFLRIGLYFNIPKELSEVLWYGRGEIENYIDRKMSAPFGLYKSNVTQMNFKYEMPQECGTRTDTRFVSVYDSKSSLNIIGCDNLIFSYHDFTLENLHSALHSNELKTADSNYLYIDYAMRGLGNHSCGPDPEEHYELHPHDFKFVFAITSNLTEEQMLQLARTDFGVKTEKITERYQPEAIERIIENFDCSIYQ